MNRMKFWLSLTLALVALVGKASGEEKSTLQAEGEALPALHVEGKNLVDANGKTVVLHGVMDTPNRYFNGWRWQQWKPNYSEEDIQPCLAYFSKLFSAITDKEQGAYCTVFRLHMDPCWTNDPNVQLTDEEKNMGEACITAFNMARYCTYLQELYIPLVKDAIAHGLYVIVRPPGVCPGDISVGDKYQRYLKAVWKAFAADEYIQQNAGLISIELANEPVRVHLSDGSDSETALHDFFQPVVDVIRQAGFKGIVWVPGAGYQSQYQNYAKHPITDSENNFSYAVHVYSGWYGASDKSCDHDAFIKQFQAQVPMVTSKPIMVTEIDWSPEDPDKASEGHYNEWGQWTQPNLGSWATASTSKWGLAWKAVHDHFGNIGMTLTHPQEYYDIDEYLKSGKVQPGFQNAKAHGLFEECCGDACMKWYKEWYLQQNPTGIESVWSDGVGKGNDGVGNGNDAFGNGAKVSHTYYYNMQGQQLFQPLKGFYIVKQVLTDGKVRSRKVCYK